ncbi:MAG: hypothetical protein IJI25_08975 [Eubacterium sp.]|nr:hypothetical protein [Eubacterium sp.]
MAFNEDWTCEVAAKMHKYRITNPELAERCKKQTGKGGYNPAYLSTVLNGNKEFKSEESAELTKNIILSALEELIAEKTKEVR